MGRRRDVDRFDRWAETYDQHWMQRAIFEPVQGTVLELAEQEIPRPGAILDVGCGTGRLLRLAEARFPGAVVSGVDAAPRMVDQAQAALVEGSRIAVQQAIAEDLPFPDARFDLVFSTLTFHHWGDQQRAVKEIARVLAPGGRWLLAEFLATGFMRYVRRLLRMKRFPVRESLDALLAVAGLRILAERRVSGLHGQVAVLVIGAHELATPAGRHSDQTTRWAGHTRKAP
ncbi:MAG: class I SAM-dependent methyltransferase [Candidatus Dormibacterales bacterium]